MKNIKILLALFLNGIVPIVVVVASYAFGLATKRYDQKTKSFRERYDNLYMPLLRWEIHSPLPWVPAESYNPDERENILKLLLDNSQYMGSNSSKLLLPLYNEHLRLNEIDIDHNLNPHNMDSISKYNDIFNEINYQLLLEASILSKRLQLPDISKSIREFYDQLEEK